MNGNTRLFIKSGLRYEDPRVMVPSKREQDIAYNWGMQWLQNECLPFLTRNIEAIMLYQIHETLGTSKKKLLEIHNGIVPMIKRLLADYEYDKDSDAMWICEHKLKTEVGIDLRQLKSPFTVNAVFEDDTKKVKK